MNDALQVGAERGRERGFFRGWYCVRWWWRDDSRLPYLRFPRWIVLLAGAGRWSCQVMRTSQHPSIRNDPIWRAHLAATERTLERGSEG